MSALTVRQLDSGWWHVRGNGPCNWAQPPTWPCGEDTLRESCFPQASEPFIRAATLLAEEMIDVEAGDKILSIEE